MRLDSVGRLISKVLCGVFFGLSLGLALGSVSTLTLEVLQKRLGIDAWISFAMCLLLFGGGWFTEES